MRPIARIRIGLGGKVILKRHDPLSISGTAAATGGAHHDTESDLKC
jgi:hypothetical protein